jgi:hypothetical protein
MIIFFTAQQTSQLLSNNPINNYAFYVHRPHRRLCLRHWCNGKPRCKGGHTSPYGCTRTNQLHLSMLHRFNLLQLSPPPFGIFLSSQRASTNAHYDNVQQESDVLLM